MPRLPAKTPTAPKRTRPSTPRTQPPRTQTPRPSPPRPSRLNSKPSSPRLVVRSSAIHAAGCISLDPIREGDIIAEYDGPRIPKSVADERYGGRPVTYLFGFGEEDFVIDGFATAMFINHSCAANCETEEQDERIFIRALRDIPAGEELVYDYHLYDSDLADEAPCHCGAPNCRGTMYSDRELTRRAKLSRRKPHTALT